MKVVCIKQDKNNKITKGKIYESTFINEILSKLNHFIVDDNGDRALYDNRLFISLEECREKQLTELGI